MKELTHRSAEALKALGHRSARLTRTAIRRLREEGGQTAAEYVGIILVVAAIIAAITASGIGGVVSTKITQTINGMQAGGGGGPAPAPGNNPSPSPAPGNNSGG